MKASFCAGVAGLIDKDNYPSAMPRPSGFIAPCLPTKVARPPSGKSWVHEIKRDRYGTRAPHLKESLSCH
jgi:hypothetical protein